MEYAYDEIGNPLTYRNDMSFTWQNGRQLAIGRVAGVKASDGQRMRFIYDKYNRLSFSKWTMNDVSLSSGYLYGAILWQGRRPNILCTNQYICQLTHIKKVL